MTNEPALNIVINNVLITLSGYLNSTPASLPTSTVSIVSATKKNPAIGSRIGTEQRGGYPTVVVKGGHLEATVQFQIWDANPDDIEIEMNGLHDRIMADKEQLRNQGFITLRSEKTTSSENISSLNAWRKTTHFQFLYEYQYQDSDEALSLITRIPIDSDLQSKNSPEREVSTVTDAIQRWDDETAMALSVIANSQSSQVYGLNLLAHLPGGWMGNSVIIERTSLDTLIAPTIYPSLNDFLEAITRPSSPDKNARVVFATLNDFVMALNLDGTTFELGDWDENLVLDEYQAYQKIFEQPIYLSKANDIFRVSYQTPSFDSKAVVYLRAKVN